MPVPNDFPQANAMMLTAFATLSAAAVSEDELSAVEQLNSILSGLVPPERVSHFFEFGYARRASLPAELLPVFADVGNFAWTYGFYGLGTDSRGIYMETLLRGDPLPVGAIEPVPNPNFVPPEPA